MSLKSLIPSVTFLLHFVVASIADKKLRVTDRLAALIPFGL